MKRLSYIFTALLLAVALCFSLASCGGDKGDDKKCTHVDADDNGKCDTCEAAFTDGCDAEHRDANDDGKCDIGGEAFTDGDDSDIPPADDDDDIPPADDDDEGDDEPETPSCTHRDADDNGKCDECNIDFSDGAEPPACEHRDEDDNSKCDYCNEPFEDGSENGGDDEGDDEPETPSCTHRDADDNSKCDYCNEAFEDGSETPAPADKPAVEDFEGDYTTDELTWECTHTSHTGAAAQSVTNLNFGTSVSAYFDPSSGYANLAGATATVNTDSASGNKYVTLSASKRISDRDRSHTLRLFPEEFVSVDEAYSYAVQFDIFIASEYKSNNFFSILWYNTDSKWIQMQARTSGDEIYLDGVKMASFDKWSTVSGRK